MNDFIRRIILLFHLSLYTLYSFLLSSNSLSQGYYLFNLLDQLKLVIPSSVFITMVTSFFISLVFSLQIVKEFLYLNANELIGSVIAISFIRELSPILTAIVLVGKVGSFFTSELGTMLITEQIDALLILGINPINYLILPRLISILITLPLLNLFSLLTSLVSSAFICFILYNINPNFFFKSVFYTSIFIDLIKSIFKTVIFAFFISLVSCVWGLTTKGGSKGVGLSTTSSVVTCLIFIFITNFLLSYFLFDSLISSFQIN
uniref:ABC transporter permease n=1 Tax=Digenea simplex TaxID=945030 RepID=A0A1Z1MTN4_DIGSM|nr:hypothetical protein [Digenea simplex]ARW69467.1 hypothetical protein [Digenea simplex]